MHVGNRSCSDAVHRAVAVTRRLKLEPAREDFEVHQVIAGSDEGVHVAERQTKLRDLCGPPIASAVIVYSQMGIAANHPAQVSTAILFVLDNGLGEGTGSNQ